MRCATCGEITFFQKECKKCERKREDQWMLDHTFVFGEKVEIILRKEFYIKPRFGIIVDKGEKVEGAYGYYFASTWYDVKLKDGTIIKLDPEYLKKL